MKIRTILWHVASVTAIAALIGWQVLRSTSESAETGYPERPIHIVVPYDAGGGSDTFVRILQKGISEDQLLDQPLVIINQPGGSGTIGSREVKNADPDGYKILCHHNAIITAKLAETVDYGPEAFEPIAMTGEMSMVILVRDDSPIKNIVDLLQTAKDKPSTVRLERTKVPLLTSLLYSYKKRCRAQNSASCRQAAEQIATAKSSVVTLKPGFFRSRNTSIFAGSKVHLQMKTFVPLPY